MRSAVVLPDPFGPMRATIDSGSHLELQTVERHDASEALLDALRLHRRAVDRGRRARPAARRARSQRPPEERGAATARSRRRRARAPPGRESRTASGRSAPRTAPRGRRSSARAGSVRRAPASPATAPSALSHPPDQHGGEQLEGQEGVVGARVGDALQLHARAHRRGPPGRPRRRMPRGAGALRARRGRARPRGAAAAPRARVPGAPRATAKNARQASTTRTSAST